MISIEGNSPEEIAKAYQDIYNKLHHEVEILFSKEYGEMMRYGPTCVIIREIEVGGVKQFFVEIERGFYANHNEEED